jgi:shikimate kinase
LGPFGETEMNFVLIGFMGVGKTSVGKRLASRLERPFIDTDAVIEEARSMTVREIFEKYGEGSFRETEKEVVARVSKLHRYIIAAGGGAVLDPVNVARLKERGLLIYLSLPLETICDRIGHDTTRPLFQKEKWRDTFETFFQDRENLYRTCSDFRVDRSRIGVEGTVDKILELLQSSLQKE